MVLETLRGMVLSEQEALNLSQNSKENINIPHNQCIKSFQIPLGVLFQTSWYDPSLLDPGNMHNDEDAAAVTVNVRRWECTNKIFVGCLLEFA